MLDFSRDGAALIARQISDDDILALREMFGAMDFRVGARPFAASPLLDRLLGQDGCFAQALTAIGLKSARPVRVLAFDKTAQNNWNLGWHQDRVIAVKQRRDVEGFGTWTVKNGVPHVEAPDMLLRQMAFLRLHLDDTPAENGALKIIPGSAEHGKLTDAATGALVKVGPVVVCDAHVGDILAVKALTLHASEPSRVPNHRRVLHVDYCALDLPSGLEWALQTHLND